MISKNIKAYISQHKLALVFSIIAASKILGFIPDLTPCFLLFLVVFFFLSMKSFKGVNVGFVLLFLACVLSILIGNPHPIFQSWLRLGLFTLTLFSLCPILLSKKMNVFRRDTLNITIFILVLTAIGSFIGYFFGVNYMKVGWGDVSVDTAGVFGGLTIHSMILGPIGAISFVSLLWVFIAKELTKKQKIIILVMIIVSILCTLLSASRSALLSALFGALVVVFFSYKHSMSKMIKFAVIISILSTAASPLFLDFSKGMIEKQKANETAGSTFSSRESRWEHRIAEFESSPVCGIGFSAIDTKYVGEYSKYKGVVEPGSSWLAILSMTGIFGFSMFCLILIKAYRRLNYYYKRNDKYPILLLGILGLFCVHFFAEGYVFAAGSYMFFLFWLTVGVALGYKPKEIESN